MSKAPKYSMEDTTEATRLEEQVFQKNYSIIEEMRRFHFNPDENILDAGCGTGVLSRYLVEKIGVKSVDAIDFSDLRLRQASDLSGHKAKNAVTFFKQDLANLNSQFHGKYDTVLCRYVIEHCVDPIRVLCELRKTLKKNGRLIVFELDGVFVNLYSENAKLNSMMRELEQALRFDLHIGKKLPSYFKRAGFTGVNWEAELISCKDERLKEEHLNTVQRFAALTGFLTEIFGSHDRCAEFKQLYLDEMMKPENTLVFTKYICTGRND